MASHILTTYVRRKPHWHLKRYLLQHLSLSLHRQDLTNESKDSKLHAPHEELQARAVRALLGQQFQSELLTKELVEDAG